MDDLNVFRIFVAVAEASSFAAAADTLGLTRSAVAKAVARLEQRTGIRLFQRTTRVIALTDEGRILCEQCARTIAELENALTGLAGRRGEPQGVLRMTMPDAYGRSRLMPVLAQFLKTWPKLEAEVSFSDRSVDVVAEGFDLALRIGGSDLSEDLVTRVVARHRVSFCASPEYLVARGEPTTVEQLGQHACLQFVQRGRQSPWRLRDRHGKTIKVHTEGRIRFDSGEALRDAATAGLGIAQLPDFLPERDLAAGRLQRVLECHEPDPIAIVALYPTRKFLSPKVRLFIDSLNVQNDL